MIESWSGSRLFVISTDFFKPLEKVDPIYFFGTTVKKIEGEKVVVRGTCRLRDFGWRVLKAQALCSAIESTAQSFVCTGGCYIGKGRPSKSICIFQAGLEKTLLWRSEDGGRSDIGCGVGEDIEMELKTIIRSCRVVVDGKVRAQWEINIVQIKMLDRRVHHLLDLATVVSEIGVWRQRWRWFKGLFEFDGWCQRRSQKTDIIATER